MELFDDEGRSEWVRLETLVLLRWFACVGQSVAAVVGALWFDLDLPVGLVTAIIGALALANLLLTALHPRNARMAPDQAIGFILFDVVQLAAILAATGGLSNPFLMLLLAPVSISATVLPFRGLLGTAGVTMLLAGLMWSAYMPLTTRSGGMLELPAPFRFGNWLALEIGIVFLSIYARRVMSEVNTMSEALFATQAALSREQKLTDLGGVVAATAHELGTPLATITLVSSELVEFLEDRPDLADDARLIRTQADRCRDILRAMGQAGNDDLMIHQAPIQSVVEDAAAPHMDRGTTVRISAEADEPGSPQPEIPRAPEIIHGIRNLTQNAVDFAESMVTIDIRWSSKTVSIRIADDGPGFPPTLIDRLGDPLVTRRRAEGRDSYEGMGLGLFIAKTLLERFGAQMRFANGSGPRQGAVVEVKWARADLETRQARAALGVNPHLSA